MYHGLRTGEDPKRLNPLSLAFIGDAVYGLMVRARLLSVTGRPVGEMHRDSVYYVRAQSQSKAFSTLESVLTPEEMGILRRGRNCSSARVPKNCATMDYRRATAVEALWGYLYLCGRSERLEELTDLIFVALTEERGACGVK